MKTHELSPQFRDTLENLASLVALSHAAGLALADQDFCLEDPARRLAADGLRLLYDRIAEHFDGLYREIGLIA